jgi:succinoglycan biosynthesis protein ExoM
MPRPISVLIPTMRRPQGLECALRSIFEQEGLNELVQDVVVVDNSPEGSARRFVDRLRRHSPAPLLYVHEPHPGVATARNAGIAACHAPYVAFLDDDEEAPPDWLARLFLVHKTCKADVTFGPVRAVTPEDSGWARPYFDRFFSRFGPDQSGLTETVYGCGNSMMSRATALASAAPFDVGLDNVGGEDDHLFQRIRAEGGAFAWAADAFVYEHVPGHRATLAYTLRRAFSYGQTPARMSYDSSPRDWAGVVKWMAVGVAQTAIYGALAAAAWAFNRLERADYADKASRGLGKVIWWRTPQFYGAAEAARTEPAPAPVTAIAAP